ncbi:LLM class F420-dependent oxidoreductase [Streptomyces solincola]|uniref:LLM class F420-dependent oxidoreductase n=1 Tax=Streptomyces solincola TaxID=2100817 RepID=A0A2S9Q1C4_9ACTN|nr:LLM class flavin-dependent oxidoreductase [Streptomyces solincola]PRH80471.1 LLM class F420-dependent oxidoreductase [Streptomyces solincola]
MRLGVNLVYQCAGELAREAERLGYDLALASEGFRSDAATVLGLVAGQTERIGLASGIMQIPARPPGTAALTAATLDALSGGRFRLGLGVSNPHVSDGWYGVRFDHPLGRTREYVDIVRQALDGGPVRYTGDHFTLPAHGRPGAPLHLFTERPSRQIPLYLAGVGPRSLQLAGEIADGWLSGFTTPEQVAKSVTEIRTGRERAGRDLTGFEVVPFVPVQVAEAGEDLAAAAARLRAHYALLLGVGDPADNFYCALARTMGFDREIAVFRDRLLAGDRAGAAAAIPLEFIDATALIGPLGRIAERMAAFAEAGVTTLSVLVSANDTDTAGRLRILRQAAEALELSGAGS